MQTPDPRLVAAPWRTARATLWLLDALEAGGKPARFVGGCVRDTLLGRARPGLDLDLATAEPPERVLALVAAAGIKAIPTGLQHGTVTAVVDHQPFEITTLRRDVATFGRHATVAFTDDFTVDAARRDFTFNAMSADRAGHLFDPFGGEADLMAGRVRFVGDPTTRIHEDYLRILRFFRFHAGFGREAPDAATLAALGAGIAGMAHLSGERLQHELWKLLAAPDPRAAVRHMDGIGLLAWLLGARVELLPFERLVTVEPAPDALRRLAALLRATADPPRTHAGLVQRLKPSRADAERLARLIAVPARDLSAEDDGELRRWLYRQGKDAALAATLFAVDRPLPGFADRLAALATPRLPLLGRDVLARGVPPGPAVGRLLAAIEAWWLEGGCVADRAACLAELARRLEAPDRP
ncbi:MAG: CCA tRNA nucleotidyltransferase [Geminicoccaceae bacterium]|nr:MAG: CCA tRNA nucleotidyltransferase [Geminicoccaceae bacterium]